MTPDARSLLAGDRCSQALGITIVEAATGRAVVRMPVTDDVLNGHGVCHGGVVFALADSAAAFAVASSGLAGVAGGCSVDFVRPVRAGSALVAVAEERHRGQATALHDVRVEDEAGRLVAVVRVRTHLRPAPS